MKKSVAKKAVAKKSTAKSPRAAGEYPVRFRVAYPKDGVSRLETLFRLVLIIPVFFIYSLLDNVETEYIGVSSSISLATLLLLLFRRKYPRWWFDFQVELARFFSRILVYLLSMRGEYPSTDEKQGVTLQIDYPDAQKLSRFLPLVKWFLAIPHYIALMVLGTCVFFVAIFAWFAILFTGKYPKSAFYFIEGVCRWSARVNGYAFLLVTDTYPPFSLTKS